MRPTNSIPETLKETKKEEIDNKETNEKDEKRIMPYPPNFKRTPAKIIEPDTGAST